VPEKETTAELVHSCILLTAPNMDSSDESSEVNFLDSNNGSHHKKSLVLGQEYFLRQSLLLQLKSIISFSSSTWT
jgi:hypothetical protein